MAHPVRPDSYIEINNFYTATVYEKGAEVVRMIRRCSRAFRKGLPQDGMDLYFERHDGQAVDLRRLVNRSTSRSRSGLLDAKGRRLQLAADAGRRHDERVLDLKQPEAGLRLRSTSPSRRCPRCCAASRRR
jgi:hypothetical protein